MESPPPTTLHVYTTAPLDRLACAHIPYARAEICSSMLSSDHMKVYFVIHKEGSDALCIHIPSWLVEDVRIIRNSMGNVITHVAIHVVYSMNRPWMITRVAPNVSWIQKKVDGMPLTTRMQTIHFDQACRMASWGTSSEA